MASQVQIEGGAFQDTEGSVVANGILVLQLSHDETVNNSQICAGFKVEIPLDTDGNIAGTVFIWGNDVLIPAGSFYTVWLYTAEGQLVWGPTNQVVTGAGPFDVGTWIPGSSVRTGQANNGILLQTNGVNNGSQSLLNLHSSDASVTLTDDGSGNVNLQAAGGSSLTAGQGIDITADVISGNLVMDSQARIPQNLANRKVITGHAILSSGQVVVTLTGNAIVNKPDSYEVVVSYFVPSSNCGFLTVTSRNQSSFTISSVDSSGSLNTLDTGTVSWVLVCKYDTLT